MENNEDMARAESRAESADSEPWEIVGWLQLSRSGKSLKVNIDGDMVGIVSIQTLHGHLNGTCNGIPIKKPPAEQGA